MLSRLGLSIYRRRVRAERRCGRASACATMAAVSTQGPGSIRRSSCSGCLVHVGEQIRRPPQCARCCNRTKAGAAVDKRVLVQGTVCIAQRTFARRACRRRPAPQRAAVPGTRHRARDPVYVGVWSSPATEQRAAAAVRAVSRSAYTSARPGQRGKGMTSRMCVTPVTNITSRSNPRPNPLCGTLP